MITFISGVPGAGKTLYALNLVVSEAAKGMRPVYYSGIADLALPWTEIDPEKWMDVPPNSIVVIDECQRVFRPRNWAGAVPPHVSDLETHRHKGIDLVLVSQHPMLIDTNVRRLVGRHFHVARRFGLKKATVLEFPSLKEQPLSKQDDAIRHDFLYPKEAFTWYKSAEVHTHKARIPLKVWLLAVIPIVVGAAGWLLYERNNPEAFNERLSHQPKAAPQGAAPAGASGPRKLTAKEWLAEQQPRVAGLSYTAPMYDEVTKPTEAPYPAACVSSSSVGCRCYSQQATRLEMPASLCQQILSNGYFKAWGSIRDQPTSVKGRPEAAAPPALPAVTG